MSCCFPRKKDRSDPHTLASEDLTPHLQLIDIRSWKNKCGNLESIFKLFVTLRAFNNMRQNFITRPKYKRTTLAKRNRIQREIQALQDMKSTKYPQAYQQPLN